MTHELADHVVSDRFLDYSLFVEVKHILLVAKLHEHIIEHNLAELVVSGYFKITNEALSRRLICNYEVFKHNYILTVIGVSKAKD